MAGGVIVVALELLPPVVDPCLNRDKLAVFDRLTVAKVQFAGKDAAWLLGIVERDSEFAADQGPVFVDQASAVLKCGTSQARTGSGKAAPCLRFPPDGDQFLARLHVGNGPLDEVFAGQVRQIPDPGGNMGCLDFGDLEQLMAAIRASRSALNASAMNSAVSCKFFIDLCTGSLISVD